MAEDNKIKETLITVIIAKKGTQHNGLEMPVGSKIKVSKADAAWMKQRELIK